MRLINILPWKVKVLIAKSRTLSVLSGNYYWGLANIDKRIIQHLSKSPKYYVELGANDGISYSNTMHLEMFRGWRGLLIEPHPGNYRRLLRTRGRQNQCVQAACVSFDFQSETMRLLYSNSMTITLDGESEITDRFSHADAGKKWLGKGELIHEFDAPAKTLDYILRSVNAPKQMGLLSLDVEGAELEVLRGINHKEFRFDVIALECRDLQHVSEFLEKHDYTLVAQVSHHDYVFRDCLVS